MAKKPDADAIREFLSELPTSAGLDAGRRWWPKYIYRSDHVENAAQILESGQLLSRTRAERDGLIATDAASPGHIAQLAARDRDLVRLYLRPRAPTQYCNEGVRPTAQIEYGAHMPVPVYFLFDAKEVLTEEGVLVSRGRLVPSAARGGTAKFLKSLDFMKVYHSTGVGPLGQHPDRGEIINSRHSEALVPGVLTLDHLRWVVCRSAPERSTLLHLLSPQARERWRPRVILEGPRVIFYKRATFVTEAVLAHDKTRASFFTQTLGPEWRGPFAAHATWSVGGVPKWTAEDATFTAPATPYVWRLPESLEQYEFRLTLDGHLVYFGSFPEDTGPSVL